MKNTIICVDTSSINRAITATNKGYRLDYRAYYSLAKGDDILLRALAYGYESGPDVKKFMDCLTRYGYQTYFRPTLMSNREAGKVIYPPNHVRVACDVLQLVGNADKVIFGIADIQYIDLCKHLLNIGKEVEIFCSNVPGPLRSVCSNYREFDVSLLNATEGV